MLRRIPADLPFFGALALGLGFLAFGFTAVVAELHLGRPSSTSSLGFVFVPIGSLLFGVLGYLLGIVARLFWRGAKPESAEAAKGSRALQRVLAIVILLASVSGMATVLIYERASQPSVIIDTGIVSTAFAINSDLLVRGSKQVFNFGTKPEIVSWGRNESELSIEDLRVRLKDRGRPLNVNLTATGLDYVTYIHAAHLATSGDRDPFLILVITGRATGRRAQVVLLNPEYKVVYQHRIERFWNLDSSPLEIRLDPSSHREVPVVGPTCEKSLVLRVHETKRR